jgi:hypothetical protein
MPNPDESAATTISLFSYSPYHITSAHAGIISQPDLMISLAISYDRRTSGMIKWVLQFTHCFATKCDFGRLESYCLVLVLL